MALEVSALPVGPASPVNLVRSRPRLLDLYCGAGGAAEGYRRAGFDVTGVDLAPQPRYPFAFIQMDALVFLDGHRIGDHYYLPFEAIHASPPCQGYSIANNVRHGRYPLLIAETRRALKATGLPYVIENVPGAPLRASTMLCGTMFGRRFSKHRYFETGWPLSELVAPCAHMGTMKSGALIDTLRSKGHRPWSADQVRWVLDVPWMTGLETRQAIPPVYTEWLGRQLVMSLPGDKVRMSPPGAIRTVDRSAEVSA